MADLFINITYPVGKPHEYKIESNVKDELIPDLLSDFIRGQSGKGKDEKEAIEREVYNLRLTVDLSFDIFNLTHDCGNEGLALGIIMDVFRRME